MRPAEGAAWAVLGVVRHFQHRWIFSTEAMNKAIECGARTPLILSILGGSLVGAGRLDEAEKSLEEAHRMEPENVMTLSFLGLLRSAQNRLPESVELNRKAVALAPENASAWANLADVHLKTGELADAEREAAKATELGPRYFANWMSLGYVLGRRG